MLREYQKKACQFAAARPYSYLAVEVGLGKSLIALALINRLKLPTLVVAPKLVATITWPEEIAKWLPELTYSVITGTAKQRDKAITCDADLHIINYENLKWLTENYKWQWPMVIFDEVSKMKSNGTRTKAFMKVRKHCQRVIGLSGTPAANSLMALFYQYKCLDGGVTFGTSVTRFRDRYFINRGFNFPDWHIRDSGERQILDAVKPTMLTMRAQDYLPELPKVITTNRYFTLSPNVKEQYDTLRDEQVITLEGEDIIAGSAAVKSGKLRQVAAGFLYNEEGNAIPVGSDKIDELKDLLAEIGDEQVLIFYWFRAEEAGLLRVVKNAVALSSRTIDDWNGDRVQYLIANPASAGHGLNLQKSSAHHIVFFTLPWDAEVYLQAIGRLLRSGNTAQAIFVHQLVAKGTVETKVVRTLNEKIQRHSRLMQ